MAIDPDFNQDEQTIVVVPSLTIDFECSSSELQAYEERFLFCSCCCATARASDLCDLANDPAQHHRLLSRSFAGVISSHAASVCFDLTL